jgi:tungstate transport system ATP-binding protein
MALIQIIGLCQRYGKQEVLKNVNVGIEKGEVFALIGPTGVGKTTLLRLIGFLEAPTAGRIYFDGIDINASGKVKLGMRRRIAFVLQRPVVFDMSIYDNIACGLKWRGKKRWEIKAKVDYLLEVTGLSAFRHKNARLLSGGEAQRVAIARALAVEPEVLLLDEPTANLDPVSISRIEQLISHMARQEMMIIMATHDMAQGQRLADRIGVLVNGEMLQVGDSRQIFSSPRNREVAKFVGVENIIDGVIASNEAEVVTIDIGGSIIEAISYYAVGAEVSACVRPEDITLTLSKTPSSARNSFIGETVRVVSIGPLVRVEMDCGFPLVALITTKSAEELNLKSGRRVCAGFKATGVHVIKRERFLCPTKSARSTQS